jgi:23S rRNA (guanosine2251-2'-O)-methyltransferase
MVHRRVKRVKRSQGLNHNRSWIWGRHVVGETLRAGRWPILELALSDKLETPVRNEFFRLAQQANVSVTESDDDRLTKLCRAGDHQGCAARMGEYPYLSGEDFLGQLRTPSRILVLDRIQDPYNFGAMIRSVECLGLDGILIGTAEQTGINSQAARSSAGAVNHVPIGRVEDLPAVVMELSRKRWQVWGATERGAVSVEQAEFHAPLALIIGNEGTGIGPDLLSLCTATVQIPMAGRVGSLNAAVSAGILCYEVVRRTVLRPQS